MTKQIDTQEFKMQVLQGQGVTLVDFFATWCGPCKMLSPILEELEKEMPSVQFAKIDVDDEQQLAMQYGIMSVPTMVIFKDGEKKEQLVGLQQKETLREKLQYYGA